LLPFLVACNGVVDATKGDTSASDTHAGDTQVEDTTPSSYGLDCAPKYEPATVCSCEVALDGSIYLLMGTVTATVLTGDPETVAEALCEGSVPQTQVAQIWTVGDGTDGTITSADLAAHDGASLLLQARDEEGALLESEFYEISADSERTTATLK
jgi:hypothetical protein